MIPVGHDNGLLRLESRGGNAKFLLGLWSTLRMPLGCVQIQAIGPMGWPYQQMHGRRRAANTAQRAQGDTASSAAMKASIARSIQR